MRARTECESRVITRGCNCTREDLLRAANVSYSVAAVRQVDDAISSATDTVEDALHRTFFPTLATRYVNWPDGLGTAAWRIWLEQDECISLTSVTSGGVALTSYYLEPANLGPPFDRLEINRATNTAFSGGTTPQRNIALVGLFGYRDDTTPAGTLAEALDASEVDVDTSDASQWGVGDVLVAGTERMTVTDRSWLTTGQAIVGSLTASAADKSITVADGTKVHPGETLLADSERMLVEDVAGNVVTVKRAVDSTVLATHSTATLYAQRTARVVRSTYGTTAATHADTLAISRVVIPALVKELSLAEALNTLEQRSSAYVRVIGSGDNARNASGGGLEDIRARTYQAYGRKVRQGSA